MRLYLILSPSGKTGNLSPINVEPERKWGLMSDAMRLQPEPDDYSTNNPFVSLGQLASVISGIDRLIFRKEGHGLDPATHHRLAYLRNTLMVTFELWQDDLHARVNRSKKDFYIYSMTDHERLSFLRRVQPGLSFAGEEMRAMAIMTLSHLTDLIAHVGDEVDYYANDNKAAIRAGVDCQEEYPYQQFHPLHLPRQDRDAG